MQYVSLLDMLQMLLENSNLINLVRVDKLYCMKILRCVLNTSTGILQYFFVLVKENQYTHCLIVSCLNCQLNLPLHGIGIWYYIQ